MTSVTIELTDKDAWILEHALAVSASLMYRSGRTQRANDVWRIYRAVVEEQEAVKAQ